MITYPFAKINIGLNVTEKRSDGYHNIESIFFPIPLNDILEINKSEHFNFSSSGTLIPGNAEDNLVIKAYKLIQSIYKIQAVSIHLHKQIPMGAGLGGGSADAAFTLLMLNDLFNLKISKAKLESLALSLGSDCPFFIHNKPMYVFGKGDKMEDIELDLSGKFIMIINPNIHISTKTAYGGVKPRHTNINMSKEVNKPLKKWHHTIKNDFESHIFDLHPKILDLKNELLNLGADYTSMTGSGSTVYGFFSKRPKPLKKHQFEVIYEL
ncbi:MAG: 4-(cytidine 5'-diphospho)-2-C-methyl-D-erythritol kinase [Crocinitomicaceae bacterium]